MKKNLLPFLIILLGATFLGFNYKKITNTIVESFENTPKVVLEQPNSYFKNKNYEYIKESENFIPYSKQDIKNIFYSIFDRGYDEFTFYCPSEYTDCLIDVDFISQDQEMLTHINNFVSPFNNFNNLKVSYLQSGEVNIKIEKLYTYEEINEVNKQIDEILSEIVKEDMSDEDKILAFHDYIINNTKYDVDRNYQKSNTAYGLLTNKYAICGGYADVMAILLNKLNIPNFKIASSTHIWNAVYLNDNWLHLDLTWDDPVSEDGKDNLLHKFYLIETTTLEDYKITDHEFDKTIYQEFFSN